jgi:dinuclear metal center YbgI/SA1388 family protein
MELKKLVAALDAEMGLDGADRFHDDSNNGLQVANGSGRVTKIALGVDATLPFFERAVEAGADLAIVHHGISWGSSLKRITNLNYRMVSYLMRNDLALWACHLPLDAHPKLGNNAQLAQALGLRQQKPFGEYHGVAIGVRGSFAKPLTRAAFFERVRRVTGNSAAMKTLEFGRATVRTVGVISGGAPSQVVDAIAAGLDAYITGESNLSAYNRALQDGINVAFAGHYATETFGVKAVGALIQKRFKLPVKFVDFKIPY